MQKPTRIEQLEMDKIDLQMEIIELKNVLLAIMSDADMSLKDARELASKVYYRFNKQAA